MLKDRTIVITGAASGLGRAWTQAFLRDGATVVAADIDEEKLEELTSLGAHTIVTDVADGTQVQRMIETLR